MDAELAGVQTIPAPEATAPEQVIQAPESSAGTQARDATQLFDVSPALFVENQGQWSDPSVRYVHDGSRVDVAVTDKGMVFQVARTRDAATTEGEGPVGPYLPFALGLADTDVLRFSASFVGASQVLPMGLERSQSEFNYFVGDPSLWRQKVPAYEQVAYEGLYDGVDLYVQGLGSHLKYEFHVAPGADWSQISIRYDGIGGLSLAGDGALLLDLSEDWGTLVDDRPVIYQVIDGQRVGVAGSFRLLDNHTYAFDLTGSYDPTRELVVDPNLVWSTYLGGSGSDGGHGVALDSGGNVYVTGRTESSGWSTSDPGTTYQGLSDAFVAKFSSAGACLWSTYLGGSEGDWGLGTTVDSGGNVYVTGVTESKEWTSDGFDTIFDGASDAFVVKLDSTGGILWSTYVGGSDRDWGYGVAVDSSDNLCVTGQTWSPVWTLGGFDMEYNGLSDGYVAKLSPTGDCRWSTYVGGSEWDWAYGIATDSSDNIYVTGATLSPNWVTGDFDTDYGGASDAFVAKLDPAGGSLWGSYLGGSAEDWANGIATDAFGNVYVAGTTSSAGWTIGDLGTTYQGVSDTFVAKLSSAGVGLWSTYLGGATGDSGESVAVDGAGNAYVTGTTDSAGWTSAGFDTTYHGGDSDAFVAKLSPAGASLWSSYLGGSAADSGYDIAVDPAGYLYATGQTQSSVWASGGFDTSYNDDGSGGDAFLVKITFGALVPVYRFWSETNRRHFYTIKESERDKLINIYSSVWAYEGVAYRAFADNSQPGVSPVYRFWSKTFSSHFYTIKEAEKDKLIRNYTEDIWKFEGIAFYAYPGGLQPPGVYAVYRFWSDSFRSHFYTIKESEKDKLINFYAAVWEYEGIAWYAHLANS